MTYSIVPIFTDERGHLNICPACFPMFPLTAPFPIHAGHHRSGFAQSRGIDIYEDGAQLLAVEECIELPGVPGLYLREFVRDASGEMLLCGRNHHGGIMVRLRYAPNAEIRRKASE